MPVPRKTIPVLAASLLGLVLVFALVHFATLRESTFRPVERPLPELDFPPFEPSVSPGVSGPARLEPDAPRSAPEPHLRARGVLGAQAGVLTDLWVADVEGAQAIRGKLAANSTLIRWGDDDDPGSSVLEIAKYLQAVGGVPLFVTDAVAGLRVRGSTPPRDLVACIDILTNSAGCCYAWTNAGVAFLSEDEFTALLEHVDGFDRAASSTRFDVTAFHAGRGDDGALRMTLSGRVRTESPLLAPLDGYVLIHRHREDTTGQGWHMFHGDLHRTAGFQSQEVHGGGRLPLRVGGTYRVEFRCSQYEFGGPYLLVLDDHPEILLTGPGPLEPDPAFFGPFAVRRVVLELARAGRAEALALARDFESTGVLALDAAGRFPYLSAHLDSEAPHQLAAMLRIAFPLAPGEGSVAWHCGLPILLERTRPELPAVLAELEGSPHHALVSPPDPPRHPLNCSRLDEREAQLLAWQVGRALEDLLDIDLDEYAESVFRGGHPIEPAVDVDALRRAWVEVSPHWDVALGAYVRPER